MGHEFSCSHLATPPLRSIIFSTICSKVDQSAVFIRDTRIRDRALVPELAFSLFLSLFKHFIGRTGARLAPQFILELIRIADTESLIMAFLTSYFVGCTTISSPAF
jgi:hypothetical protein